jgi:hypothetical protein
MLCRSRCSARSLRDTRTYATGDGIHSAILVSYLEELEDRLCAAAIAGSRPTP